MKCNLCHMPFQQGKQVYEFPRGDGTPEPYHMSCFCETSQGRMGYCPTRVFTYQESDHDSYVSRYRTHPALAASAGVRIESDVMPFFPGYEWMQQ